MLVKCKMISFYCFEIAFAYDTDCFFASMIPMGVR